MIPRTLIVAIVVCLIVVVGATAVGRAIDSEVQDRVIITRNGQTADCRHEVYEDGSVYWIDCHPVTIP